MASLSVHERRMAEALGIEEEGYLWIAQEAADAQLPGGWQELVDEAGNVFYYEQGSGQTSREHPSMRYYKKLYDEFKAKDEELAMLQVEKKEKEKGRRKSNEVDETSKLLLSFSGDAAISSKYREDVKELELSALSAIDKEMENEEQRFAQKLQTFLQKRDVNTEMSKSVASTISRVNDQNTEQIKKALEDLTHQILASNRDIKGLLQRQDSESNECEKCKELCEQLLATKRALEETTEANEELRMRMREKEMQVRALEKKMQQRELPAASQDKREEASQQDSKPGALVPQAVPPLPPDKDERQGIETSMVSSASSFNVKQVEEDRRVEVLQAELAALREKSDKVEKLEREVAMAHHHVTHLEFLAQEYVDKLNQVTRVNERLKVELEAKGRGLQTDN
ncbi:hypothetical protein GUITHDRAFT_87868, partial [Guillardia theta CCMP2712]